MLRLIPVVIVTNKAGNIRPLYVVWEDVLYKIRSIRNIRNAESKGILYECVIENCMRHLYHKDSRWYIEQSLG